MGHAQRSRSCVHRARRTGWAVDGHGLITDVFASGRILWAPGLSWACRTNQLQVVHGHMELHRGGRRPLSSGSGAVGHGTASAHPSTDRRCACRCACMMRDAYHGAFCTPGHVLPEPPPVGMDPRGSRYSPASLGFLRADATLGAGHDAASSPCSTLAAASTRLLVAWALLATPARARPVVTSHRLGLPTLPFCMGGLSAWRGIYTHRSAPWTASPGSHWERLPTVPLGALLWD